MVVWARVVAQNLAFVGAVAGFWHISWIAGVGMLAGGVMAVTVHAAGYLGLKRDQTPTAQAARHPATATPDRLPQPAAWPVDPRPFAWTRTADEILNTIAAYCHRINDSGH
jgi:hypothetical protein